MTENEQGVCLLRLVNRRADLQRELAVLNQRAEDYRRDLLAAASYLEPATVRPGDLDIEPTEMIQLRNFPSNEDINALISEFGEKRTELVNVQDRIKRMGA